MRKPLTPLLWMASALAFLFGGYWRVQRILLLFPPTKNLYSDMGFIVQQSQKLLAPETRPDQYWSIHPPGLLYFLSGFYRADPTGDCMIFVQFFVSLLIPFASAALALTLFGQRSAALCFIAACLYFPFIDYGSYYLPEVYLSLLAPLFLFAAIQGLHTHSLVHRMFFGLLSGLLLSVLGLFRSYFFVSGFAVLLSLLIFQRNFPFRSRLLLSLCLFLGTLPGLFLSNTHCEQVSGRSCLGSHSVAADVLLGHYGRGGMFTWKDDLGGSASFQNPSASQRGRDENQTFAFSITDEKANLSKAWEWIRENPLLAVSQSFEHVEDSFLATYPWPNSAQPDFVTGMCFHYLFLFFILAPALFYLRDEARGKSFFAFLGSDEGLLMAPIFGFLVVILLGVGEARLRVPLDPLFFALAAAFFSTVRKAPLTANSDF